MSVLDKIKILSETVEDFSKEKSTVTITSNSKLLVENYKSVKLFSNDKLILDLEDTNLYITGEELVIRTFSPVSLVLEGNIKNLSYVLEEDV